MGYISQQEGYFPTKKTETIDLETVVINMDKESSPNKPSQKIVKMLLDEANDFSCATANDVARLLWVAAKRHAW
jgi:hypothetical protein